MNCKEKGSRAERKTIAVLEAAGYICTKAGGSLGIFDVVCLGPKDVRAIQVKAGFSRLRPYEREQIQMLDLADNVSKEVWVWEDRARKPMIEVL